MAAGSAKKAGRAPAHSMLLVTISGIAAMDCPLEHDAGVAQVLVAVDQIDLPYLDQPALGALDEAVAAPAREIARAVDAKLADQEIRAHHAGLFVGGREYLDVRHHPHGAGFRRL